MARTRRPEPCPCGGPTLAACCAPLLAGKTLAGDAETLMRSRYSAYATGNAEYLLATWHPTTRPQRIDFEAGCKWIGLTVQAHRRLDDDHAEVAFVARYRIGGRAYRLTEDSRFERVDGCWYYVDGRVAAD